MNSKAGRLFASAILSLSLAMALPALASAQNTQPTAGSPAVTQEQLHSAIRGANRHTDRRIWVLRKEARKMNADTRTAINDAVEQQAAVNGATKQGLQKHQSEINHANGAISNLMQGTSRNGLWLLWLSVALGIVIILSVCGFFYLRGHSKRLRRQLEEEMYLTNPDLSLLIEKCTELRKKFPKGSSQKEHAVPFTVVLKPGKGYTSGGTVKGFRAVFEEGDLNAQLPWIFHMDDPVPIKFKHVYSYASKHLGIHPSLLRTPQQDTFPVAAS